MVRVATLDDPRVAPYRTLANPAALARAGLLVAESRFVLGRLLVSPQRLRVHSVLLTSTALDALQDTLARLDDETPVYVVDQALMDEVAGFRIHRGCLALAERPAISVLAGPDLSTARRVLVMEGVNNPDNVGGIFRSAHAFAVDLVVLGPACGDPFYRKAIRTSMAATLHVPFVMAGEWPQALRMIAAHGFQVIALTPAAEARSLEEYPRDPVRVALVVGAEGDGLSAPAMAEAGDRVRVRMRGDADSLNVTVAASIALHYFSL